MLLSCSAEAAQFPVDIIFVVDASASIGSVIFAQAKLFVSQMIDYFDIDSGLVRVGACSYSVSVTSSFNLSDHTTRVAVKTAVLSLVYSGGSADLAAVLKFVRTTMLTSAAGDRINVFNIIVILTDGPSSDPLGVQVSPTRQLFVTLLARMSDCCEGDWAYLQNSSPYGELRDRLSV